jgi:prepilin-type N-terminal cleavage/methylation domain-containing protein
MSRFAALLLSVRRRVRGGQQGFSLIELMVAAAAGTIILGAVLAVYVTSLYAFANQRQRMINNDVTRVAVDQLSRYLRAVSYPESTQRIADAIEVAQPNDIVFYTDLSGDGLSDKVEYYISGPANQASLKMKSVAPNMGAVPPSYGAYTQDGIVVLSAIRTVACPVVFTYYWVDSSYSPNRLVAYTAAQLAAPLSASQRAAIVAIGIRLVANEVPLIAKGDVELSTTVQIRQRYNGGLTGQ